MRLRCPGILALLIFALPVFAHAQSLGDLARQFHAERQQSGVSPKVYTNDDLSRLPADGVSQSPLPESATEEPSATGAEAGNGKSPAAKEHKSQELEKQERAQDINQQYREQIDGIRSQISAAQKDLDRLQRDQAESTNEFRSSAGTSPSIPQYERQQETFNQQMEDLRNRIAGLHSQLDDAEESARHAGVPHAGD